MATSFQLYIDKENTPVPLKHAGSGQGLGVRGVGLTPNVKTFAGKDSSLPRSAPRSALRDVNSVVPQQPLKSQPLKDQLVPIQQLFKKPALKDDVLSYRKERSSVSNEKHQKSKINTEAKQRVNLKAPEPLPEIEHMHIVDETETQPKLDREFIGVIAKIRRWKPPCFFFGGHEESESEDEGVDNLSDLDPPQQQFGLDDIALEGIDVDCDIDIPIPEIDMDSPIPFLDDTLDSHPDSFTELQGSPH